MKNEFNDNNVNNSFNYNNRNINTSNIEYKATNKLGENEKWTNQDGTRLIKKKTQEISGLIKTFATVVAASMMGIAGIGIFPTPTTTKAEIIDLWSAQNEVYYSVELENYDENNTYYVVLYNDFTNRTEQIEDNAYQGYFENLQTNMTYTLAVKQGKTIIASKTIKTGERKQDPQDYEPSQNDNNPTGETDPTGRT